MFYIRLPINANITEKLINHIINYTESLKKKEYNNIILYFSDDKEYCVIEKIL